MTIPAKRSSDTSVNTYKLFDLLVYESVTRRLRACLRTWNALFFLTPIKWLQKNLCCRQANTFPSYFVHPIEEWSDGANKWRKPRNPGVHLLHSADKPLQVSTSHERVHVLHIVEVRRVEALFVQDEDTIAPADRIEEQRTLSSIQFKFCVTQKSRNTT